jgi:hypothetical protein
MTTPEEKSVAKKEKQSETLEFYSSHKGKNITISKENYDKLVAEGYPTDHLSKKRENL